MYSAATSISRLTPFSIKKAFSSANFVNLTFTDGSYGNLVGNYFTANYITNNIRFCNKFRLLSVKDSRGLKRRF
jgi:hypothetical protein